MSSKNREKLTTLSAILKKMGSEDLAKLLSSGLGEVDMSSQYGTYWNSVISQYLIYLPVDRYMESKKISKNDRDKILAAVTEIYPHGEGEPEIVSVEFRVLRKEEEIEDEFLLMSNEVKCDREHASELNKKCKERIKSGDYSGAITASGSLLEEVLDDISIKVTGESLGKSGDLRKDYRHIKDLLNLTTEKFTNESVKSILGGVSSIVNGLDSLNNKMGDRHKRKYTPSKHHALLCVNSAFTIIDFLYDTLEFQSLKISELYSELYELLDSDLRLLKTTDLLANEEIIKHLLKYDDYQKMRLKDYVVNNFEITRYRESDIFFSIIYLFFESLSAKDIKIILTEPRLYNSQACGVENFVKLVEAERPQILTKEAKDLIKEIAIKEVEGIPF